MNNSKIVYDGKVLIDLTQDSITPEKLAEGVTAHDAKGDPIVGTNTYDADTQDATATAATLLKDIIAYARGVKIIGEMPNIGSAALKIKSKDEILQIAQGYHDGSGSAAIDDIEKAKLTPENIREGVSVLGVTGTMTGSEGIISQSKEITPTAAGFTVLPDEGYTHLTEVIIKPFPYVETENSAGGITVTIG